MSVSQMGRFSWEFVPTIHEQMNEYVNKRQNTPRCLLNMIRKPGFDHIRLTYGSFESLKSLNTN